MKILLVNAYTQNTGDAVLLSVLIHQLRQQWPNSEIIISSLDDPEHYPKFEGCPNIGSIRQYVGITDRSKLRRMLRKILVLVVGTVWPRLPCGLRGVFSNLLPNQLGRELIELERADFVISAGGGYMNAVDSLAGDLNIRYLLLPLQLAVRIHKPIILAPQSFGCFGNQRQATAVRRVLNRAESILVREDKSFDILTSIGVQRGLLSRAVDSGFAFDTTVINRTKKAHDSGPKIGITARAWLPKPKQQAYERALASFITTAHQNHQAQISLIPQVTSALYHDDDRIVERRIASLARQFGAEVTQIEKRLDHHEVKRAYARQDFVIGTRFHSVVLSLTSYVPAIAIECEHKTSGIMHDLGLSDWVIPIEEVTAEKLTELFDRLVIERQAYICHLRQVLPDYIRQANGVGEVIKQAYQHAVDAADTAIQPVQK